MKPALIAVSFGTSYPETRKKTIGAVEEKLAEKYPELDVFRAFTSNKVIKKDQRARKCNGFNGRTTDEKTDY